MLQTDHAQRSQYILLRDPITFILIIDDPYHGSLPITRGGNQRQKSIAKYVMVLASSVTCRSPLPR